QRSRNFRAIRTDPIRSPGLSGTRKSAVIRIGERPTNAHVGRLVVLMGVVVSAAVSASSDACAAGPTKPPRAPAAAPGEESLSDRRAVRGVAVDDVGAPETPELRELRRFEEQAFPRAGV